MTNFSGKVGNLESFTFTSDAVTAQGTVGLAGTPASDNAILWYTPTAMRLVEFVSRSGTSCVVCMRKVGTETVGTAGALDEIPSNMTEATGAWTKTSTGPSSELSGAQSQAYMNATIGHTHDLTIDKIARHGHKLNDDTTKMLATNESSTVICVYALA